MGIVPFSAGGERLNRRAGLCPKGLATMFAVMRSGGKQYRVAPNDIIRVEKLEAEVGATVSLDEVLLVGEGDAVTVGTPAIDGASVVAEVLDQFRGPKVLVFKKKRRKNYRRKQGHRQALTLLRVTEIKASGTSKTQENG